jgi:hypothetical protein
MNEFPTENKPRVLKKQPRSNEKSKATPSKKDDKVQENKPAKANQARKAFFL